MMRDLAANGIITKKRPLSSGAVRGGINFGKGPSPISLRNRMYVGEVTNQGRVYPGEQPAIIDRDLFDAVQAKLASQWTPLKQACLRRCRSPLEFLTTEWREGPRGVFVMGLRHGAYCLGCCWVLMLLLFVGGIMNMAWIAGIAVFVLVEKLAPAGHWIGKAAGGLLVLWGLATLVW